MAVDPTCLSGRLLVFWAAHIKGHQIVFNRYSMEVEFESEDYQSNFWGIFVYASTDENIRKDQWRELLNKRRNWGEKWFLGGDFNDILQIEEMKGGNKRKEFTMKPFRNFVRNMGMKDLGFQARKWMWGNNKQDEGFCRGKAG